MMGDSVNTSAAPLPAGGLPGAEIILDEKSVRAGLDRLATRLQPLLDQSDCILLGVLTGGLFPLLQLAQRLRGNFRLDTCQASRYRGGTAGGEVTWLKEPHLELEHATVIIVDDIYDAGITLEAVAEYCRLNGAHKIHTAALFIKDCSRSATVRPLDYDAGLVVPDRYVFGCGMDLHERWRHLSSVYALIEPAQES
jgi:hypoxanthine phosphoribosyltransferase